MKNYDDEYEYIKRKELEQASKTTARYLVEHEEWEEIESILDARLDNVTDKEKLITEVEAELNRMSFKKWEILQQKFIRGMI